MKTASDFAQWLSVYESGIINITDEVKFDTYQKLKDIERMKNCTYLNPKYPDDMDKFIYNLGQIMHFTLYRFSDKDAKELQLVAQTDEGLKNITFFKAMLRGYLNDSNYDKVMNDDRSKVIDGHLMTKEINNKSYPVRLLNVVRDWSNKNIEDTGMAERTFPSRESLWQAYESMAESNEKKQFKKLLDDTEITRESLCVHEWWTEDDFVKGKKTKGCIKLLDCRKYTPEDTKDGQVAWFPHIIIDRMVSPATKVIVDTEEIAYWKKKGLLEGENRIPSYPYKETRFFEREGRALGIGVWEAIEGIIEHFNENWNEKRRFDRFAAKGVKVYTRNSKDRSITQEVLNRIDTNAILEIKPGEKFEMFNAGTVTPEHLATVDKLFDLARQTLGIAPSAVIEPNASQSATAASYEQENAKSTYAIIGEIMNLYYQELFRDFKIPSIVKHLSKKQNIRLMGSRSEMETIDDKLATNLMYEGVKNNPVKMHLNGSRLLPEEEQKIKSAIKHLNKRDGNMRIVGKLPKEVLDMFRYDIVFYSGSTSFDKRERMQVYNELVVQAQQNPNSRYSVDRIMEAKLDLYDVDPKMLEKTPEELQREKVMAEQQQMQQQQKMANLPNTSVI